MSDLIDRQAAIEALNEYFARIGKLKRRGLTKGEKAISLDTVGVIKTMPTAQPDPNCSEIPNNSDTISRQAAIDALNEVTIVHSITDFDAISAILDLPSIQPKRGRWLYCEDTTADCVDGYRCDQCGFFVPWDYQHKSIDYIKDYNFCPNCGADMREATNGN